MVVITDRGSDNIHPPQKEPVGARLALAARALAYGEKIEYSGPLFESVKVEARRTVITFSHVAGGLVAKGGDLKGFEIAGEDRKFLPAKATIEGGRVVVSADAVAKPAAVTFWMGEYTGCESL